ncbi:precorrin-3B C(17)-methyltransferase [Pilimelia anulata]|uniref:Precorrin-3B C(17)-methyltransferase n=1 Tax=Pilimelia anulata TaxID=53371 RepID=A0A8J3B3J7_9ACTN|nr:precorrin-3B C(17)-methyltransferase [Pilimelia anulata]GGJ90816.1 precorrin-3B C(17)-methyltransferase [Pilimelia anulata]
MSGHLYGVGVGPGDPELVTVRAARLIGAADVVAYHSARHGRSTARAAAAPYLAAGVVEEPLVYPVTVESTDHPGGYRGALDDFYAAATARLAAHLDAGRTVVVLAEGDPFLYGSYQHLHKRLAHRYPTTVVPGVTSVTAAAAALGRPLAERDEVLTILPATLPAAELARRLAGDQPAVLMKLGRTFAGVRTALADAGRLAEARYVERASHPGERVGELADIDPASVPYFAVALLPSRLGAPDPPAAAAAAQPTVTAEPTGVAEPDVTAKSAATAERDVTAQPAINTEPAGTTQPAGATEPDVGDAGPAGVAGGVVVVGLGPAGRDWLTPEAAAALAAADDVVGYGPYVDRLPANPRQRRHRSDNRVEAERAEFALDLAARGRTVAVVSAGDPGIFAMAAAVLEVAAEPRWRGVPVRVLPGLTAAQAVASRAGAPLGHDFCVLSLSDRLKPWPVIRQRLAAAAAADLVAALYNPASRERNRIAEVRDLFLAHRAPDTPVVVGRAVGEPGGTVAVVDLAALDPAAIDMRTLVIIGSTRTRRGPHDTVYTPRWYPG